MADDYPECPPLSAPATVDELPAYTRAASALLSDLAQFRHQHEHLAVHAVAALDALDTTLHAITADDAHDGISAAQQRLHDARLARRAANRGPAQQRRTAHDAVLHTEAELQGLVTAEATRADDVNSHLRTLSRYVAAMRSVDMHTTLMVKAADARDEDSKPKPHVQVFTQGRRLIPVQLR